jgi:hypothetical protein
MELIIRAHDSSLPSVFTVRPDARKRMRDFFSSHIRNPNTRRAYHEAVRQFSAFCVEIGIADLCQVEPVHVAAFGRLQREPRAALPCSSRVFHGAFTAWRSEGFPAGFGGRSVYPFGRDTTGSGRLLLTGLHRPERLQKITIALKGALHCGYGRGHYFFTLLFARRF